MRMRASRPPQSSGARVPQPGALCGRGTQQAPQAALRAQPLVG